MKINDTLLYLTNVPIHLINRPILFIKIKSYYLIKNEHERVIKRMNEIVIYINKIIPFEAKAKADFGCNTLRCNT